MTDKITVGLFGTCGNSKWRDKFMVEYKAKGIDYFNPDAGDDWHPGMIADENKHLQEDNIILFPVTDETLGLGSLGEIGFSVLNAYRNINKGSGQYLIAMIDDECNDKQATDKERDHSVKTRKLTKSKLVDIEHPNVFVVKDIESMRKASISLVDVIRRQEAIHITYGKAK